MAFSTIAAIATPPGQGAIALIRISGPESFAIGRRLLRPFADPPEARLQRFARCVDGEGATIDEVLYTPFPGPGSFTGEDVLEISCHGGLVVTQCLLQRILELGAAPAGPGEFSQRAFLNGKLDLTQAEAIMDLISARSELALRAAGQQLAGRLGEETERLRLALIPVCAHVEAYIDFPEEDIDPASLEKIDEDLHAIGERIGSLLATADRGRILRDGVRTVLCGIPNAGKSSLLNLLVGYDRAIVSHRPGTTRDTIEEFITLDGMPLRIVDTAGIRASDDDIESEGIARSRAQLEQAELVLLVFDGTRDRGQTEALSVPQGRATVSILNKSDLEVHPDWIGDEAVVSLSCETGEGMEELRRAINLAVTGNASGFERADLVAINSRHQHYLGLAAQRIASARSSLASGESPEFSAFELREALDSIAAIAGRTDIEEILAAVFSTFCIGK